MASNSGRPIVDCDEVWKEVGQVNFGRTSPTNEHDRHSVKGMVTLMMETRDAINNPEQWGASQEQVRTFEDKLRQMRVLLAEECKIARRVDPKVPAVGEQGGRWRVHPQGN